MTRRPGLIATAVTVALAASAPAALAATIEGPQLGAHDLYYVADAGERNRLEVRSTGEPGPDGYDLERIEFHDPGATIRSVPDALDAEDDRLLGGAGEDRVTGTAGADILAGGPGADVLDGGAGRDYVAGDNGSFGDRVDGDGDDTLSGGDGDDVLEGDAGSDLLRGGAGDDALYGDHDCFHDFKSCDDVARDVLEPGDGMDTLYAGGDGAMLARTRDLFRDEVRCAAGEDTVEADALDDVSAACDTVTLGLPPILFP